MHAPLDTLLFCIYDLMMMLDDLGRELRLNDSFCKGTAITPRGFTGAGEEGAAASRAHAHQSHHGGTSPERL